MVCSTLMLPLFIIKWLAKVCLKTCLACLLTVLAVRSQSFKLKYNSNYIDQIWTILQEDFVFKFPESSCKDNLHYKRYYKKVTSFSGKNYQLVLGNFLSSCARKGLEFSTVLKDLQKMIIWQDIALHYDKTIRRKLS
ncbi:MAG: hypothetical protein ACR2PT_04760 [Endozoicomonas sp.]